MTSASDSPHEAFQHVLTTVVSQAYGAAGYALEDAPMQWAGGLFRFVTQFPRGDYAGLYGVIEYQHLPYAENTNPDGDLGRFRITLARSDQPSGKLSRHPASVRRLLAALIVQDFFTPLLPSPDYWWAYRNTGELGEALGESGHLVIGFGIPWLAGELLPE